MNVHFTKYHGTGNDFILIDDRELFFPARDHELIARLCHRRFGIGADGLILVRSHPELDFEMIYFNADGFVGSMCGNGGRCTVDFAHSLGIIDRKTNFQAYDGPHLATLEENFVKLEMGQVSEIKKTGNDWLLDTGSPHLVSFVENIDQFDVYYEGKKLRYDRSVSDKGVNVNFIEREDHLTVKIRTYERGVENETLSCGTGSIAAAMAFHERYSGKDGPFSYHVIAPGGSLEVSFLKKNNTFEKVFLNGPATKVFSGEVDI